MRDKSITTNMLHLTSGVSGSVTLGGWIDAKAKLSWWTEVTQWGLGTKTQ